MAIGALDANGIWLYGEDDPASPVSDLLNLGMDSASDAVGDAKARLTAIETWQGTRVSGVQGVGHGPATQTDFSSAAVVISTVVTCLAGHKYEVCANYEGSQLTSTGVASVRLSGSTGVPTNRLTFASTPAGTTLFGSVVALYEPTATTNRAFQIVASTSAGFIRIAANAASIWVKDVTE